MSQMICTSCGTMGKPKTITKGSFLVEIILWLFFLVPGLIYTLWRLTTKTRGCRSCGASTMVPLDSPLGQKLKRELT